MNSDIKIIKEANQLQNQIVYHIIAKSLILATQLKLADHLTTVPIELKELAKRLNLHLQAAQRFFRLLETLNLVEITLEQSIKATPLTPYLDQIYSEHYFGSFLAFNYFEEALSTNKETWSKAFGMPFYEYLKKDSNKLNDFQLYLETTAENWLTFIPKVFDFSNYKTIVDLGGGKGQLLAKIIEKTNKNINGVLFEKEEIILNAKEYLSQKNLLEKISLIKGDFLTDDLPKGNLYLLCRVLLNWGDEKASKIINNCLKYSNQKLIIIDFVIPKKNHKQYQRAVLHDLNLLVVFGGRIRDLRAWKDLINNTTDRKAKYKIIDEDLNAVLNVPMIMIEF